MDCGGPRRPPSNGDLGLLLVIFLVNPFPVARALSNTRIHIFQPALFFLLLLLLLLLLSLSLSPTQVSLSPVYVLLLSLCGRRHCPLPTAHCPLLPNTMPFAWASTF